MGFHASDVALEVAVMLPGVLDVVRARDAELADQMKRACMSMVLNVPEGGRRGGKDRGYHFRIAAGSAAELRAALRLAFAWKYCEPHDELLALLDRELAMLWRLCRARHNLHYVESRIMPS